MPITYTGLLPARGITALSGVSVHDAEADQVVGLGLWGQEQSVLEQMMEQKQRLDQQDKRLLKLECGSSVAAEGSSMSKLELTSDCGSGRIDAVLEDRVRVLEEQLQQIASNVSQLSRGLLEERHRQDLVLENMSREIEGIRNVDRSLSTAPDPNSVAEHDNLSKRLEELEHEQAQLKEQQGKVDSYLESWSSKQAEHNQSECNSEEWQSFHRLHGSVWDAFLVQWFHTSRIKSASTVFLYCLNIFIQGTMVYLIFINMSLAHWIEDGELLDLLRWRLGVAHRMDYYSWDSDTSLATRVCQYDGATILSELQSSTLGLVEGYRINNKPFNGPMLCMIAMLIWVMSIFRELGDIIKSTFAILSFKGYAEKAHLQMRTSVRLGKHVKWPWRVLMCLMVPLPRLIIGVWLGISGVMFLAQNRDLTDLILNSMALGFVLDMDELLYILVPKHIAQAVADAGYFPIKTKVVHIFGAAISLDDLFSDGLWALLFPSLLAAYASLLQPLYSNLDLAHTILCGGTQNIVLDEDMSNNVMMYVMTAEVASYPDLSKNYIYEPYAVAQTIGLLHDSAGLQSMFTQLPEQIGQLAQKTSLGMIDTLHRITMEEAQKEQLCLDVDYNEPARASLRELLGMQSCKMTSGDDLLGRCGEPAVRRYCPQTCYCNAVSWWYDLSSCPVKCWPEYASNLTRHIQLQERGNACMEEPENEPLRFGHLPFLGGNLTFFSSFVSKELMDKGHLSESAHPSAAVQTRVKWISRNECRLKRNVPMSIEAIVSAGHCEGLMWVDTVFDIRLCEIKERYDSGLQNIAAFCPGSCQVCSLPADAKRRSIFDYTFRSIADRWMYSHVEAYIECGYEWIFSGESLNGTLSPDEHYIGKPAPEKVYSFWAPEGISYSFKATGSLALDLFIYDKLAESPLYQRRNFLSHRKPSRLNNISFTKEGRYHLVVESRFLPRDTSEFTISM